MRTIKLKRGFTFAPSIDVSDLAGLDVNISNWGIESAIQNVDTKFKKSLSIENRNDAAGTFSIAKFDTSTLAAGRYIWDIKITINGLVSHTDSVTIDLSEPVT